MEKKFMALKEWLKQKRSLKENEEKMEEIEQFLSLSIFQQQSEKKAEDT